VRAAEVVIIGGGPAGLIAAAETARLGLDVLLLEEDEIVGRPERCAGLYSIRGLERLGIQLSKKYVQNLVWGGVIHSPSGEAFEVSSPEPVAIVAERESFDRYLAERALKMGVETRLGSRATSCSLGIDSKSCVTRLEGGAEIKSEAAIIAEGSAARLSRRVFKDYYAPFWLPIVQLIVKNHGLDKRAAHVWFKSYLKDFFGYLVPINEELGKLGVAARQDPLRKAQRLIKEEMPGAKILGYSVHSVYRGPPLELGLKGRILLAGDVAGQVKATTGGGIVTGGLCAKAAASHIHKLLREGVDGAYKTATRGLYRELKATYWISRMLSGLSDKNLDDIIRSIRESGFNKSLSFRGDMDFQVTGVLKSLATVQGLRFATSLMRSLI